MATSTELVGRFDAVAQDNGGAAFKARRLAAGLSLRSMASLADVDRGQLGQFEAGKTQPQDWWIARLEEALERHESEQPTPRVVETEGQGPGFLRLRVEGVYGTKSLVVEGPVDDPEALAAAVDAIMRRIAAQEADAGDE